MSPIERSGVRVAPHIFTSGTTVTHTGDTTETVLGTASLAPGEIGPNGQVLVIALFTRNAVGAASVSGSIRFGLAGAGIGGTTVVGLSAILTTAQLSLLELVEWANAASPSSQVFYPFTTTGAPYNTPSATTPTTTMAINTASACDVIITGKCANAADLVGLKYFRVIVYPGA